MSWRSRRMPDRAFNRWFSRFDVPSGASVPFGPTQVTALHSAPAARERLPQRVFAAVLVVALALAAAAPAVARSNKLDGVSAAVVKLYVTQQRWNVLQPWTKTPARQVTCSGFLTERGIMTNAHCVADATFIQVELMGYPDKFTADVIAVNHQIDIALIALEPAAQALLRQVRPIRFGALPAHREKVVTVGYPTGGQQISYTEGVVSRIDIMESAHGNLPALMVQTDAAINPGNSGGPVFSDASGECLGIATQKNSAGEGLGYFVPTPMILQFLGDINDGDVDGIPNLGVALQPLENDALRVRLGMPKGTSGVRVKAVATGSTADGVLQVDDVLLAIDGHPIYNDGRVPFRGNDKIALGYHIYPKIVGERLRLDVLRDGKRHNLEVTLKPFRYGIVPLEPRFERPPDFVVIGGLVLMAVDANYLERWGGPFSNRVPLGLARYVREPIGSNGLRELVVIADVYDAALNKGYGHSIENIRVAAVNGTPIHDLAELRAAVAATTDVAYLELRLEDDTLVVLDRARLAAEERAIRARYGIPE